MTGTTPVRPRMPRRAPPGTGALWLPVVVAGLWAVAEVLAGSDALPDEIREVLAIWKNGFGVVFFATAALVRPAALRPTRLGLISAPFPLYAAFRLWSNGGSASPLVALYLAWWWGFFVVVPAAFRRRRDYRLVVGSIMGAALLATALGVLLGLAGGEVLWWDHERVVFSFTNPIYFAYGGLTIAVAAFFLLGRAKRGARLVYWFVAALGLTVVLVARARNGLLFGAAFALAYGLSGRRHRLVSGTVLGAGILAVALAIGSQFADRLDELSSGRLTLWEAVMEENMGELTVRGALFGVGDFEQTVLNSHDAVVAAARFARAHTDNAYLDLFLSLGLLGTGLFLYPLGLVGTALLREIPRRHPDEPVRRDVRIAVATLAGLLMQGIVVSNLPSLGNLMNLLCMTMVMAVAGHVGLLERPRPAAAPVRRPGVIGRTQAWPVVGT